jgi:hypothetical protein
MNTVQDANGLVDGKLHCDKCNEHVEYVYETCLGFICEVCKQAANEEDL